MEFLLVLYIYNQIIVHICKTDICRDNWFVIQLTSRFSLISTTQEYNLCNSKITCPALILLVSASLQLTMRKTLLVTTQKHSSSKTSQQHSRYNCRWERAVSLISGVSVCRTCANVKRKQRSVATQNKAIQVNSNDVTTDLPCHLMLD